MKSAIEVIASVQIGRCLVTIVSHHYLRREKKGG